MLPVARRRPINPLHVRVRAWRGRVGLGLVGSLSVLAGMTDAIGFLATGDFVSFMSGNTTRLAVAISQGDLSLIVRLALAVLAFIAGNTLGILLGRWGGRRALPLMLGIAGLLCGAALLPFESQVPALLAAIVAMGMLNAAVEQVNGLPVGLTYVTGALSRFGRGLGRWLLGERRSGWRVQLVPWSGMLLGAVLGAVLEAHFGVKALLFSAGFAALLGVVSLKIPRRWQRDYMPR
ncbi:MULTISPECIES: YoaK family protein [Pseudomonas]|uniref:DUF1275 domain-containing protein n=1 Tax=Pseudomonas weihenstephanensis TaxID=1608994 RepID=A0ABS1ZKX8_9PSED|nr:MULTISPECIES: YoaK family protein [Pseudomonas]KVV07888.1 putative membrane protein [Pseudomonas sp. TAD18]KVV09217.1 putative membrane protein [Pseudomonas sp. TAA207]MBM1197142.1 DUF1275 domain-containing protein [Pseudomonas weihenstephanensis]